MNGRGRERERDRSIKKEEWGGEYPKLALYDILRQGISLQLRANKSQHKLLHKGKLVNSHYACDTNTMALYSTSKLYMCD